MPWIIFIWVSFRCYSLGFLDVCVYTIFCPENFWAMMSLFFFKGAIFLFLEFQWFLCCSYQIYPKGLLSSVCIFWKYFSMVFSFILKLFSNSVIRGVIQLIFFISNCYQLMRLSVSFSLLLPSFLVLFLYEDFNLYAHIMSLVGCKFIWILWTSSTFSFLSP